MDNILIEILNKTHDKEGFDCGHAELNKYFSCYSSQNHKKNINRTHVAIQQESRALPKKEVLGFYSLANGQVSYSILPTNIKHPRYPVSVARITRLAVAKKMHGNGLGGFLLYDAIKKIKEISDLIGTYGVVVDAKNESAVNFYRHYGFLDLQDNFQTLFLPMSTINKSGI